MTRMIAAAGLALLLGGCVQSAAPVQCPDPAAVAPASIGGAAFVAGLSGRLAGPDRENSITEAIGAIHQRDPSLGADRITDILIAADCPVAASRPDNGAAADRARIAGFRAQVDQLLDR